MFWASPASQVSQLGGSGTACGTASAEKGVHDLGVGLMWNVTLLVGGF